MRSYSRAAPGAAVPYRHRDPAWLTPAELEALAAADRRHKLPEPAGQAERDQARAGAMRQYAQLRDADMYQWEAAAAVGVSRYTASSWDRARKEAP